MCGKMVQTLLEILLGLIIDLIINQKSAHILDEPIL
jgi:hypothetical protein